MDTAWALPFVASAAMTAGIVPLLRRLAVATGFVDRPGAHKSHHRPTPYLGGVGVIAGVLTGMVVSGRVGMQVIVIALGAGILGTVGLVDDHRTVHPGIRLLLQLGAASVPVLLGLQVSVTGIDLVDMALTLVWIVGITNGFNLLDNMDGLSAGVASGAGLAVLGLATLGGQDPAASSAAALVGASLGFLAYNRRPASIFMGDTGSLFLGFAVAVLAIEVDPAISPPASFFIPLLVLALPMLDTGTVVLARVRRGRSVLLGGRDHLSHRLVALGLSPGPAVGVLISVELLMAALAVAAGRKAMPLWGAVFAGALLLALLSVVTGRAPVYKDAIRGWPRPLVVAASGAAAVLAVLVTVADERLAGPASLRPIAAASTLAWGSVAGAGLIMGSTLLAITWSRRDSGRLAEEHSFSE